MRLTLTVLFMQWACDAAALPTLSPADWAVMGGCTVVAALSLTHLLIDPPPALRRFRL